MPGPLAKAAARFGVNLIADKYLSPEGKKLASSASKGFISNKGGNQAKAGKKKRRKSGIRKGGR